MIEKIYKLKEYNIPSELQLVLKNNDNVEYVDLETIQGLWDLSILEMNNMVISYHFYNPEYASVIASFNKIAPIKNIQSCEINLGPKKLTEKISTTPICQSIDVYNNGFIVNKKNIRIHPHIFFNKVVGLMFIL